MNRIHLMLLWHMHQPQYRDPSTGRYILPWTRLHALKDYWGMVRLLEEFPQMHATINVVPSLGAQLEEYASGKFDEPWFSIAFTPADKLTPVDKAEILVRAFQVNRENVMRRWPRYSELFDWSQRSAPEAVARTFGKRSDVFFTHCSLPPLRLRWRSSGGDSFLVSTRSVLCGTP